jgi:preprotein translocase subunit SecA
VESQNFSVRKHLLEYDDVMNKQRENIYALRRQILEGRVQIAEDEVVDTRAYLMSLAGDVLDGDVETYCGPKMNPEDWDLEALRRDVSRVFALEPEQLAPVEFGGRTSEEISDALWAVISRKYDEKEHLIGSEMLRRVERDVMLQIVDGQWKDHLYSLDHLKEGIGLRGYGQRDPLVEYKRESFDLFQDMKTRVDEDMVRYLWWLRPVPADEAASPRVRAPRRAAPAAVIESAQSASAFAGGAVGPVAAAGGGGRPRPARTGGDDAPIHTVRRDAPKVGRNDPCPCGSGKKYKKCHGAAA